VLAAANPISGRFAPLSANASIMQSFKETGLETPLASRFDLIWLLQDTPEPGLDEKIAHHILQNRTSGVSELQIEDKMGSEPIPDSEEIMDIGHDQKQHLTTNFLRKYVAYAKRNIHPSLDDEAKGTLIKYYIKTRNSFNQRQNNPRSADYGISQSDKNQITEIPVTARALEALMRLTEAHARIHLRQIATVADAEVAKAIFMHWRNESNIRDESEFQTGMSQQKQSSTVRIIMQDISDANEGLMKMSQIIDAALAEGISETIVRNAISNLHRGGTIYESQTGTYQWT
jgi:replicative DNA helicase Mcm